MYDSSSVSTLFSSLGSSKSTGSGLFGINLSEYASIRSGSYGKLMRSYFSMDSTKGTSKSDDSTKNTIEDLATTTSTSKDSTKTLAAIESDAKELTGIELPAYNKFLADMQEVVPAINSRGYYSKSKGCYLHIDEAEGEEKEWIEKYHMLQYNSMFDKKNRSSFFFPYNLKSK